MKWITLKKPIKFMANKEVLGPEILPCYALAVGIDEDNLVTQILFVDEIGIRVVGNNTQDLNGYAPVELEHIIDTQHL